MKTATDTHEAGQVVQTTTTRRVIPVDQPSEERKTPEFWAYLEALDSPGWERHLLYVYRRVSDSGPLIPLDKCSGYITMPDRSQVALNNREEVEFAIANKFGGGIYRLILKRNRERITEGKVVVEGLPKHVQPISDGGPTVSPMSEAGATADIAHHAINTVANQDKAGMQMGIEAMGFALNAIKNAATATPPAPPPPSESDQMLKLMMIKMMEKMVDRMDAPAAVASVTPGSNPVVEKILNTAVERMLNPPASGPVSSTGAELVRTLPQVASHVGDAIREWRMGMEAQHATAVLMTGKPGVALPAAQVRPPTPPPTASPGATAMPAIPLEFIESKIVEIMADSETTDEAAADCFQFLERLDKSLPKTLTEQGEAGLMQLFQTRPILRQAANNVPALVDFIKAFLKYAAENGEQPGAAVKPN